MSAHSDILALVEAHETVTITMIRKAVSVRWSAIPPLLNQMVNAGELVRIEQGVYAAARRAEALKAVASDGPAALAVLRALQSGNKTMPDLSLACRAWIGNEQAMSIVFKLVRRGEIGRAARGAFTLTPKGAKRLPQAAAVLPMMTPYKAPPAPPRRPGSMDFLRAPSIYPVQPA